MGSAAPRSPKSALCLQSRYLISHAILVAEQNAINNGIRAENALPGDPRSLQGSVSSSRSFMTVVIVTHSNSQENTPGFPRSFRAHCMGRRRCKKSDMHNVAAGIKRRQFGRMGIDGRIQSAPWPLPSLLSVCLFRPL